MTRQQSSLIFMIIFGLTLGFLAYTSIHFLTEMNSSSYLLYTGAQPTRMIVNNYQYGLSLKGFIVSATFLISGICFLTMILLPSKGDISVVVPGKPGQPTPKTPAEKVLAEAVQEEVGRIDGFQSQPALLAADSSPLQYEEGEDDVVYGTGLISNKAIIDFVNNYPDTALKFIFGKKIDGNALSISDENIYHDWVARGMTREKVIEYIFSVMDWKEFPDQTISEIWYMLRDQLFDLLH